MKLTDMDFSFDTRGPAAVQVHSLVVNQLGGFYGGIYATTANRKYRCVCCWDIIESKEQHVYCMGDREHLSCYLETSSDINKLVGP